MRAIYLAAAAALLLGTTASNAAQITGEYLESRTCDVYTGPCFANAEMDLAGKEAVMAWKVDRGSWKGVSLDGLGVALAITAQGTLGDDGIFGMKAGRVKAVLMVDKKASPQQREALIAFVKDSAPEFTKEIAAVHVVPIELKNDHLEGKGLFTAGKLAKIETRALTKGDCVCTNEVVYYQPLTKVQDFSPAYSKTISFQGKGLNNRWTTNAIRSSFLATFRK